MSMLGEMQERLHKANVERKCPIRWSFSIKGWRKLLRENRGTLVRLDFNTVLGLPFDTEKKQETDFVLVVK